MNVYTDPHTHLLQSDLPALYHPARTAPGEQVVVEGDEARHLRALRVGHNQRVVLLDGAGGMAEARLLSSGREQAQLEVERSVVVVREPWPYIRLAFGILDDRARNEWLVEKATELGARELIPLYTERGGERWNAERARRIAVAALKQSRRAWLPLLAEPVQLRTLLHHPRGENERVHFFHERAEQQRTPDALDAVHPIAREDHLLLLVGPEGGFSQKEVADAEAQGAEVLSLGPIRLRAETAALVALAATRSRG